MAHVERGSRYRYQRGDAAVSPKVNGLLNHIRGVTRGTETSYVSCVDLPNGADLALALSGRGDGLLQLPLRRITGVSMHGVVAIKFR